MTMTSPPSKPVFKPAYVATIGPASEAVADSFFDTPARSSLAEVRAKAQRLADVPLVGQFLESHPGAAVLLDGNRQIVAFNQKAAAAFRARNESEILGARIGEAEECVRAYDRPAGCGTTLSCKECGIAKAIRVARTSGQATVNDEAWLTIIDRGQERSLEVRAQTSRIVIDEEAFTLLAFEDIAEEKRRETLERVFFHDVLNTANVLSGACQMMEVVNEPAQMEKLRATLRRSATQLVNEIQAQRDLMLAERGDLLPVMKPTSSNGLLDAVSAMYEGTPVAGSRRIVRRGIDPDVMIRTDAAQALRCLGNLVRNALEAVADEWTVTLQADVTARSVVFSVHNDGAIPSEIQAHMFERAVSSKAARGRGIGTYSVKLIAERYLDGRVSFTSNEQAGTVFLLELPRS
jgi:signal transduction histidine kinase